jgi:hypothetical protein
MSKGKLKNLTKKELLAILNRVWGLLVIITNHTRKGSIINNAKRHKPGKCN